MSAPNLLYYGDNLDVLRQHVGSETVDLVYLDPPFKSNADYNVLFSSHGKKSESQIKAFEDTWEWNEDAAAILFATIKRAGGDVAQALKAFQKLLPGSDMLAYLAMMAPRLVELRRALKPTGSLYLHCDPTASHYLKILLDSIFGPTNFRSEITWKRTGSHSSANRWGPVHDVLLFYAKTAGKHTWNRPYRPLPEEHRKRHYRLKDEEGRVYTHGELTGAGTRKGKSGETWHGFDVTSIGRHWTTTVDRLDELDADGRIYWPPTGGWPRLIRYEDESKGQAVGDVWEDIPPLNMRAKERLGYPTQKPEALLERIMRASSNEGDLVLDPFCGCGTTVAVAQRLKRRWIGIDITFVATNLIKTRLRDHWGDLIDKTYHVVGEPVSLEDAEELAKTDYYQFQWWALGLVGARGGPETEKKGGDFGIDGRLPFQDDPKALPKEIILSVKAGSTGPAHVRDLIGTMKHEDAEMGALITFNEPTKGMHTAAADEGFYTSPTWHKDYPRVQLLTVGDLLSGKARLEYPPQTDVTFKKAPKARYDEPAADELPFE